MANKAPDYLKSVLQDTIHLDGDDDSTVEDTNLFATLEKDPAFHTFIERSTSKIFVKGMSTVIDGVLQLIETGNKTLTKSDVAYAMSEAHASNGDQGPLAAAWSKAYYKIKKQEDRVKAELLKVEQERDRKAAADRQAMADLAIKKRAAAQAAENLKKQQKRDHETTNVYLPNELARLESGLTSIEQEQVRAGIKKILKQAEAQTDTWSSSLLARELTPEETRKCKVNGLEIAWQQYYASGRLGSGNPTSRTKGIVLVRSLLMFEAKHNFFLTNDEIIKVYGNKDLSKFGLA